MKLIIDLKKLNQKARRVIGFAKGNQTAVHEILCSYLHHVANTKDIRPLKRFINDMPESTRKNSMNKWCETYGPLKFVKGEMKRDSEGTLKLGEAMESPYWKMKGVAEAVEYKPMTDKNIIQFVKRLEKDRAELGEDSVGVEALKALKALGM